ncbi:MAG: hypothetical protein RW306_16270 [Geobacteraceae bacterium]|nr:hypothetical protein [Geobacteraceae bacterium]
MKYSKGINILVALLLTISFAGCGGDGGNQGTTTLVGGSVQGNKLVLDNSVTTFAGSSFVSGAIDAVGTAARFNTPNGVTTDGTSLFVADNINHTIRKILISTGAVTTIAGVAGSSGSADGIGTNARFYNPLGITTDGINIYVADSNNNTIRRIVISTGLVTTLAGTAGISGSADGTGASARFNGLSGITTDGTNLYVADIYNNTIRKVVISTGAVTTLSGIAGIQGSADGTGTSATFYWPSGLTTDGTSLYVTDRGNGTIRKISISTGVVSTMAGVAGIHGFADGVGSAAQFYNPMGITSDGTSLYITDYVDNVIRKLDISSNSVTTIAGSAGIQGALDGIGSLARFYWPTGITTDGQSLFIVDSQNNSIRKIR